MENSRKGRNLRSVALFLAMLIITPLLIFFFFFTKSATKKTAYQHSPHTTVRRARLNHPPTSR